jgi:hypothetical protein
MCTLLKINYATLGFLYYEEALIKTRHITVTE